jgi:hypothetical protein
MADLVLRGGRVIDPASGRDETADIALGDGKITEIARDLPASGAEIVPAPLSRWAVVRNPSQKQTRQATHWCSLILRV